jgi:hypothetical protein
VSVTAADRGAQPRQPVPTADPAVSAAVARPAAVPGGSRAAAAVKTAALADRLRQRADARAARSVEDDLVVDLETVAGPPASELARSEFTVSETTVSETTESAAAGAGSTVPAGAGAGPEPDRLPELGVQTGLALVTAGSAAARSGAAGEPDTDEVAVGAGDVLSARPVPVAEPDPGVGSRPPGDVSLAHGHADVVVENVADQLEVADDDCRVSAAGADVVDTTDDAPVAKLAAPAVASDGTAVVTPGGGNGARSATGSVSAGGRTTDPGRDPAKPTTTRHTATTASGGRRARRPPAEMPRGGADGRLDSAGETLHKLTLEIPAPLVDALAQWELQQARNGQRLYRERAIDAALTRLPDDIDALTDLVRALPEQLRTTEFELVGTRVRASVYQRLKLLRPELRVRRIRGVYLRQVYTAAIYDYLTALGVPVPLE